MGGLDMHAVNVSTLRSELFQVLDEVSNGEIVIIKRHGQIVAKLVPAKATNWREGVQVRTRLGDEPDKAFAPVDDIWVEQT